MLNGLITVLEDYTRETFGLDIDFFKWLLWLFTPILISFLFPATIVLLFYMSALFVRIYQYRYRIQAAYHRDVWDGARNSLATCWDALGWVWHGYEIVGIENIPDRGGALLVFYHGALPIDYYYMLAKTILVKRRCIRTVGDHFLFKIPGWNLIIQVCHVFSGEREQCIALLKEGHLVALSPGGVLEAQFGDENYKLMWGKRMGFARVALAAGVPIIPVFTQNIRESFRSVGLGMGTAILLWIYEKTRLPVVPIYGGFPVKMRTFVGSPIPYDPKLSDEELAKKTSDAIYDLIRAHQRLPGSILMALLDRLR